MNKYVGLSYYCQGCREKVIAPLGHAEIIHRDPIMWSQPCYGLRWICPHCGALEARWLSYQPTEIKEDVNTKGGAM